MVKHLEDVNESYLGHLLVALRIGLYLLIITLVCLTHAILPFILTDTTKRMVAHINQFLQERGS